MERGSVRRRGGRRGRKERRRASCSSRPRAWVFRWRSMSWLRRATCSPRKCRRD